MKQTLKKVVITTTDNHFPVTNVIISQMDREEVFEYFKKCKVIHSLTEMMGVTAHRSKSKEINSILLQINDLQNDLTDLLNDEEAKTPILAKLRYLEAVLQVLSEESQVLLMEEIKKNRKEVKPNLVTEAVFIGKTKKSQKLWNKKRILEELDLPNLSKAKRQMLERFLEKL